jgi:hypothetical protein
VTVLCTLGHGVAMLPGVGENLSGIRRWIAGVISGPSYRLQGNARQADARQPHSVRPNDHIYRNADGRARAGKVSITAAAVINLRRPGGRPLPAPSDNASGLSEVGLTCHLEDDRLSTITSGLGIDSSVRRLTVCGCAPSLRRPSGIPSGSRVRLPAVTQLC